MKNILIILSLFTLTFTSTHAQEGNISVSATIVTKNKTLKTKEKKPKQKYDANIGYQQMIELGSQLDLSYDGNKGGTGVTYIGGWRFNNYVFLGAGISLEWAHQVVSRETSNYIKESCDNNLICYELDDLCYYSVSQDGGSLNGLYIPSFIHLRTYFARTSCSPYGALSVGGRFSSKNSGPYLDLSTGVDYRINQKYHMYISIGGWLFHGRQLFSHPMPTDVEYYFTNDSCMDNNCPFMIGEHIHIYHYPAYSSRQIYAGVSAHVGISF